MAPNMDLKCAKCGNITFKSREEMRIHFSSEFHNANLIRAMDKKPVLTKKEFDNLMFKSSYKGKKTERTKCQKCIPCKKTFTNEGSYRTHLNSKQHRVNHVRSVSKNLVKAGIKEALATASSEDSNDPYVRSVKKNTKGEEGTVAKENEQYCLACKETFISENAYLAHSKTLKHKKAIKHINLIKKRKANLEEQDKIEEEMEVEEVDSDEWEDDEPEENMEVINEVPLELLRCLFCSYKSINLKTNLGHMERHHSFFVPHNQACDTAAFIKYLANKINEGNMCIDCNKSFETITGVQKHMLDKPHMSIRFEGEYDQFFEIEKIMAPLSLPVAVPESEWFAFPMPDGTILCHRDLKRFFRQRLKNSKDAVVRAVKQRNAIAHIGNKSASTALMAAKKEQKRLKRDTAAFQTKEIKKNLKVSTKANKLQPHFRLQVMNAG